MTFTKIGNGRKLAVAGAGLAMALSMGANTAHADVSYNQKMTPASAYDCGDQDRITGGYDAGPVHLQQHALIYRHCASSGSIRVKGNRVADVDGPCTTVAAGEARVIDVRYTVPRQVWYGGALRC